MNFHSVFVECFIDQCEMKGMSAANLPWSSNFVKAKTDEERTMSNNENVNCLVQVVNDIYLVHLVNSQRKFVVCDLCGGFRLTQSGQ